MKSKNILYLVVLAFSFVACKKDRTLSYEVEKSFPDPTTKFEDLKKVIAASIDGFEMVIQSSNGVMYGGYVKLDGAGNAKFVGDNNAINATTPKDSKYNLSISQTNSVLSFNRTSDFGVFAIGLAADTSYSYKISVGDTLKLVGNSSGTKLSLIKTTKAVSDEYLAGKMLVPFTGVNNISAFKKYFRRITVGGNSYDIQINSNDKRITFTYASGAEAKLYTTHYYFSNNGVNFEAPFINGTSKISGLNNFVLNPTTSTATFNVGTLTGSLTNEIAPSVINKAAANAFLATTDQQWASSTAFTKDAVVDYLNIRAITGFSRIIHWVGYDVDYDLIGFVFGNSIRYGPAVIPHIGTNGIMIFELYGVLGTLPTNSDRTKVVTTINNFLDTKGFYVVQIAGGAYDLVAVNGGNLWISYQ